MSIGPNDRFSLLKDTHFSPQVWNKYDNLFKRYGMKHGVSWMWLKAISINESSLGTNPSVMNGITNPLNYAGSASHDGKSWGIMQIALKTAKYLDMLATPEKLNNPEYSIDLGAQYVSQLGKYFDAKDMRFMEYVIKSFNQGPGNTKKEIDGKIIGYAHDYWEKFKRNLFLVQQIDTVAE